MASFWQRSTVQVRVTLICCGILPLAGAAAFAPRAPKTVDSRSPHSSPPYNILSLGTVEGRPFIAVALNDKGVVIGYPERKRVGTREFTPRNGYIWSNGQFKKIGNPPAGEELVPLGINSSGEVVCSRKTTGRVSIYLWSRNRMRMIASFTGYFGDWYERAFINNLGDIVFTERENDGHSRTFMWTKAGGLKTISLRGAESTTAYALNDKQEVLVQAVSQQRMLRTVLWRAGQEQLLDGLPLQGVTAMNNRGQVVGNLPIFDPGSTVQAVPTHPFLWWNGSLRDLAEKANLNHGSWMGGDPGVNDRGEIIVGSALWRNGGIQELKSLVSRPGAWQSLSGHAINNAGQITGSGFLKSEPRSFLMTPRNSGTPNSPTKTETTRK